MNGTREMLRVMAEAYRPRRRVGLVAWADSNRVLAGKDGLRTGAWRTDAVPYMRGIAEAMGSGLFRRLTVLKPTQTGFTEWLVNYIGWLADTAPQSVMVAMPAKESLGPVMGESGRIYRALSLVPSIAPMLKGRNASQIIIKLPSMEIHGAGSGSERQAMSKQVRSVLADDGQELSDEYLDLLLGRTTSFSGREMVVVGGTPGYEGAAMDARYRQGDQRRYLCPCPACGVWQTLEFAQIRWPKTQIADAAAAGAVYQCAACREGIGQDAKTPMLAAGVWVPTRWGESTVKTELFAGGAEGLSAAASGSPLLLAAGVDGATAAAEAKKAFDDKPWRHASFWVKGAMHAFEPWGKLAYEFVEKGCKPTPKWWNERAGEPWRAPGQRMDVKAIVGKMTPIELGGYARGTVPPGVLLLVAACDVQMDRIVYEIVGYGENQLRATVQAGEIGYSGDAGLAGVLLNLARSTYALDKRHVYRSRGHERMGILAGAADSGHWQGRVYAAVRAVVATDGGKHRHWVASRGVGQVGIGQGGWTSDIPFDLKRPERSADGRGVREDSVVVMRVNVNHYKDILGDMLRSGGASAGDAGAVSVGGDGARGVWMMPAVGALEKAEQAMSGWWAKQLASEERRVRTARTGRTVTEWQKRPGISDNHAWDVAVIADALADAKGLRREPHTLAAWLRAIGTGGQRSDERRATSDEKRQGERRRDRAWEGLGE